MTTELLPCPQQADYIFKCIRKFYTNGVNGAQQAQDMAYRMAVHLPPDTRTRPAQSADAVAVAEKIFEECNIGAPFRLEHATDLLEAFRQQIHGEAIEMAAEVAESYATPEESRDGCGAASAIRSLTPLERKGK